MKFKTQKMRPMNQSFIRILNNTFLTELINLFVKLSHLQLN